MATRHSMTHHGEELGHAIQPAHDRGRREWVVTVNHGPLSPARTLILGALTVGNLLVLPLSAAVTGPRTVPVVVNGLLIHLLGVGLPAASFARAAAERPGAA